MCIGRLDDHTWLGRFQALLGEISGHRELFQEESLSLYVLEGPRIYRTAPGPPGAVAAAASSSPAP
jgi:hypothetical protein